MAVVMCLTCTIEEVTGIADLQSDEGQDALDQYREEHGGRIPWPKATKQMQEAAGYIRALYENPAGGTGGPLHITTDDFNVSDRNLKFCRDHLKTWTGYNADPIDDERARTLSLWILDLLDPMTDAERSVTVALAHDHLKVIGYDGSIFMPSTEVPIKEDIFDNRGKRIGMRWGFRSRTLPES